MILVTVHWYPANCNLRNPHLKFCFAKGGLLTPESLSYAAKQQVFHCWVNSSDLIIYLHGKYRPEVECGSQVFPLPQLYLKKEKKETPRTRKCRMLRKWEKNVTVFIKCSYLSGKVFYICEDWGSAYAQSSSVWNTDVWRKKCMEN